MTGFSFKLSLLKLRAGWRKLVAPRPGRFLQLASYLLVLGLFVAGGYLLFFRIFSYLVGLESIGRPLVARLLSTTFLAFLLMLFLSNLITSLSTLYQSAEVDFLLATPLAVRQLFLYRLSHNIFYSSWATLLLGLPLVCALFAAQGAPLWRVLAGLAMLAPFVLIPSLAAVALLLVSIRLFPRLTLRSLLAFLFLLIAAGSWLFFAFGQPQGISINQIDSMAELERYLSGLALTSNSLLPSTWLTEALVASGAGSLGYTMVRLWLLSVTAMFLAAVCRALADRYYLGTLLNRITSASQRSAETALLRSWLGRRLPIAAKDVLLFFRNPNQWAQAFIFLSLLVLYLGSLRRYPLLFTFELWKVVISFINFAFAGYILATLSVRFIFPTVSLEGPMLWLVRTAPLSTARLFLEKALLSVVGALMLAEFLSLASNRILQTAPGIQALSHFSLAMMCLTVTCLTLGLGAVWPEYREPNPSRIASGLGGMLAALASLTYVGLSIVILAWPAYRYSLHQWQGRTGYRGALLLALAAFLALSAVATVVPLRLGLRSLRRRDV